MTDHHYERICKEIEEMGEDKARFLLKEKNGVPSQHRYYFEHCLESREREREESARLARDEREERNLSISEESRDAAKRAAAAAERASASAERQSIEAERQSSIAEEHLSVARRQATLAAIAAAEATIALIDSKTSAIHNGIIWLLETIFT